MASVAPEPAPAEQTDSLSSTDYYGEYHGQDIGHLRLLHARLAGNGSPAFVFLCGDSSFDNKFWEWGMTDPHPKPVPLRPSIGLKLGGWTGSRSLTHEDMQRPENTARACNGLDDVLLPPRMVKDVAYWFNYHAEARFGSGRVCTLNAAVEESMLRDRDKRLLPQDEFVRATVTDADSVVVSIGGNDIAFNPTLSTIMCVGLVARLWPRWMIRRGIAPGFGHLLHLFHTETQRYICRLLDGKRPQKVVVCAHSRAKLAPIASTRRVLFSAVARAQVCTITSTRSRAILPDGPTPPCRRLCLPPGPHPSHA